MEQRFDQLETLITSLYDFTRGEFKYMHEKFTSIDLRFDRVEERLDRVETKLDRVEINTSSHDGRITALEDSMKVIKTRLGYN